MIKPNKNIKLILSSILLLILVTLSSINIWANDVFSNSVASIYISLNQE